MFHAMFHVEHVNNMTVVIIHMPFYKNWPLTPLKHILHWQLIQHQHKGCTFGFGFFHVGMGTLWLWVAYFGRHVAVHCVGVMSITLHQVAVGYGHHNVLHPITGTFAQGSLTAIMGANGGGKSTLLKTIAGVLTPRAGFVTCTQTLAYLPQQSAIDRAFPMSVLDTVLAGCWAGMGIFGAGRAYKKLALQALHTVGLESCAHCTVQQLSVGQLQRLLFARLMLQDAPVVLLDEPFAALDESTTTDLVALVKDWHQQGKTVLIVLHDTQQVKALCPNTLLLCGGKVRAWGNTADVLVPQHLHALTPAPHGHSYAA